MGAQWKAKGKELAANARGKLFGRLAKDIMIAARNGADPASNSRLRLVVEQARKVSMPKDTLDRAIKKGAGLTGEAVNFEAVMYEGYAPHRTCGDSYKQYSKSTRRISFFGSSQCRRLECSLGKLSPQCLQFFTRIFFDGVFVQPHLRDEPTG